MRLLLRRPVWRCEGAGAAVLVDRRASHDHGAAAAAAVSIVGAGFRQQRAEPEGDAGLAARVPAAVSLAVVNCTSSYSVV